ncbi:tryptophan synthase alpha chain [Antricoccus suffuscus]|uniref:Tryptophan synthase alpha chain n=1 Tax=Antricoccus suffuscus TaxID=1629062 RepID=A0A2T0Z5V3_9ACTN|nr:tryptophan synthase subunit alpha [Antricoccus suffuscus]PRZ31702.1 tryptophan synthase alpha chain [Antricoccus suffuscus]
MSKVDAVFEAARSDNRAALVGYLPAGYPSRANSADCFNALIDNGCDIVEIGLPYSDPVIDGPTVQAAADQALADGTKIVDVLRIVSEVSDAGGVAVIMSYWAPIVRYGVDRFARDLASAGGQGIITPDLIPDEAAEWIAASDAHGLDRIFLVAPSSRPDRLKMTVENCRGFVYAASTMGVTGARDTVGAGAAELVRRTKEFTDLPVGVGLGVRTPEHVREVGAYADAVIVGSALVSAVASDPAHPAHAAGAFAADLSKATGR